MKYNININQTKCLEFGLNLQQGALIDIISHLSTWAETITTEQGVYYYLSRGKLTNELPIVSTKKDTFQKIIKEIKNKGLLEHYHDQTTKRGYYRLSALGKSFTLEEKNPQAGGKKSSTLEEKNPHYNNTIYNTTNDKFSSDEENTDVCNNKEDNKDSFCNNKEIYIEENITEDCKNKKEIKKEKAKIEENVFEKLWSWYPGKKDAKQPAKKYFDKLIKTEYDLELLRFALPLYIKTVKDKQYLVLLRTYLAEQRYLDYKDQFNNNKKKEETIEDVKEESNNDIKLKYKRTYNN